MSKDVLKVQNSHKRDENIVLHTSGHRYEIKTDPHTRYTSVTTWIHKHFPKFDADQSINNMMNSNKWKPGHQYWGMTAEEIKASWNKKGDNAANSGTELHEDIEYFMNNEALKDVSYTHEDLLKVGTSSNESVEWQYFINYLKDNLDLKPYRTEWLVYDEDLKLSGSIDMVYENPDGTLMIYDWKRAKDIPKENDWRRNASNPIIGHFPDTKYWQYSLQLNVYKRILERKYGKKVTKLCLVKLHPETECKNYEILDVPILEDEVDKLFKEQEELVNKKKK